MSKTWATATPSIETETVPAASEPAKIMGVAVVAAKSANTMAAAAALSTSTAVTNKVQEEDLSIWLFCISNPWDAKDLKGKGLKLTSTFNPTSPTVMGPYGHGEHDG